MTQVLGSISFLDTPDVNGDLVLTSVSGVAAGNVTGTANQTTVSGTTSPIVGLASNLVMPGIEGFVMPSGTTAQRPTTPIVGEQRYNTTLLEPEIYSNGAWLPGYRVVQTVSGTISSTLYTNIASKTTNASLLSTDGASIWSTTFTPLVVGSNLTIQYAVTAYCSNGPRTLFAAAFVGAGATSVGAVGTNVITATATAGNYNLALNCVYQTTSTAALTIQGRLIPYFLTTAATVSVGCNMLFNKLPFGTSLSTEWRIIETLP